MNSVAIVGGGIAGVSTASALRASGFDGAVTLIDSGDFPYDRPPLTKDFLAGRSDLKQIALQPPEWYDRQRIELRSRTEATALRPQAGGVELADGGFVSADRVVLATGGRARTLPGRGAQTLRTVQDAERLRLALTPGARILVLGAGLIGAEVAATAASLGCEVVLADPAAPPLADVVGAELATWLHDEHRRRGITTVQGTADAVPGRFDAVVAGVGMVPETTLARAAGLTVGRGITVDAGLTTSHPAVLAVGDCAGRAEHWEAAQNDGALAAATLLGRETPTPTVPWFWTDRHGHHVEVVGRMADALGTVVRGTFDDPAFAIFGLRGSRVVAAAAVNDSTAIRAARRLIDRGVEVDPGSLADRAVNLRRMLRGPS